MRPTTTILLAMLGGWEGVFGLQDAIDVGCWGGKSRKAARIIITRGEISAGSQESPQGSAASHINIVATPWDPRGPCRGEDGSADPGAHGHESLRKF